MKARIFVQCRLQSPTQALCARQNTTKVEMLHYTDISSCCMQNGCINRAERKLYITGNLHQTVGGLMFAAFEGRGRSPVRPPLNIPLDNNRLGIQNNMNIHLNYASDCKVLHTRYILHVIIYYTFCQYSEVASHLCFFTLHMNIRPLVTKNKSTIWIQTYTASQKKQWHET